MTLGGCDAESGSEHREDVRRGKDEWSDKLGQVGIMRNAWRWQSGVISRNSFVSYESMKMG